MTKDNMMDNSDININSELSIPSGELNIKTSRSGGPGGQHVNTSDTKVELIFDVANSPSLSQSQKQKILDALQNRIDSEGILHVHSQAHRSQLRNREEAIGRFADLLRAALKQRKKRRPTKPSKAAKERRLEQKRQRGPKKERRKKIDLD